MNAVIRKAELRDAEGIVRAEQEIAWESGFFCSQPSELSEQNVKNTIESSHSVYFVAECNGCIAAHAFLEILPLQSLKHIAQLNIAVHKGFETACINLHKSTNIYTNEQICQSRRSRNYIGS